MFAGISGVKRIYAIEANPFYFSVLKRKIIIKCLSVKITALCLPISEFSSITNFNLSSTDAGTIGNEIAPKKTKSKTISVMAASFCLDELFRIQIINNVTHMKIDVDGIEKGILRGAKKLLNSPKLKSVLVEDINGHQNEKSELDELMAQHGFVNSIVWGQDGSANKIYKKQPA